MGKIHHLPVSAREKFDHKRVSRKGRSERKGQLPLFKASAPVLTLNTGLSPFEEALLLDERASEGASAYYRRAIEEGDCVADAYCNLGIIESDAGEVDKSIECFTRSLKEDAAHYESHFNLGNVYFDLGQLQPARVHYNLATHSNPEDPNVYFNLALVEMLDGRVDDAVEALEQYRTLVPAEDASKASDVLHSLNKSLTHARRTKPASDRPSKRGTST